MSIFIVPGHQRPSCQMHEEAIWSETNGKLRHLEGRVFVGDMETSLSPLYRSPTEGVSLENTPADFIPSSSSGCAGLCEQSRLNLKMKCPEARYFVPD